MNGRVTCRLAGDAPVAKRVELLMLQRDYITEMTRRFVEALTRRLRSALLDQDPEAIADLEQAIGELLDLDGTTALSLDASSLVTMMELSGIADSLASYVCYALLRVADAYEARGDAALAAARRDQATAVSGAFLCELGGVPAELRELDEDIAAQLGER